jgi:hypothetical protein
MNYFSIDFFYGIGFGIEAITDLFGLHEEEDEAGEDIMVPAMFNGVLIDFLCFRMVIGRKTPCETT